MSRALHIAYGLLALLAANVAAAAITLSPLPGSTPQAARPGQGFPNTVGVVATDENNAPVEGLLVTFTMPGNWIFSSPINLDNVGMTTDANGVAYVPGPAGVWAIADPGAYVATASAPGAIGATFDLSVGGAPPAAISIVSGANQTIQPGGLAQPFVVQIVDASGAPVPYPIAVFFAPQGSPPAIYTSFNGGQEIAVATGDANGFVSSPQLMAGDVSGSDFVAVDVFDAPGSQIFNTNPLRITIGAPPPPPVTLSAVAGSTPQSTRLFSFFPVPIAVKAAHADGTPAPNVTVTFTSDPSVVQVPGYTGNPSFDVVTGADGIATASSPISPGYVSFATGSTSVTASSTAAGNQVEFDLGVTGAPQTRMEILSGSGQTAIAGGRFAPLVVRAADDKGPSPYAAVQFISSQPGGAGDPAVSFNGSTLFYVPADAQGIAKSPAPVALATAGTPFVSAQVLSQPTSSIGASISFGLSISTGNPGYGLLRPWQVPPLSIPVGSATAIPFAMQVLDASGHPVASTPVIFTTDPGCGTFAGSRTVTATSDANGIATAPLFTGTHASVSCATSARVMGQSRDLTMHVFDPSKLQVSLTPSFVVVHYLDENYGLSLAFTERGRPVHFSQIAVSALPHVGASYAESIVDVLDNTAFVGFAPSQQRAAYVVQVTVAGQRFLVPVVQVP